MKPEGVNMTNVKQLNRASVLQLLIQNGSMSRTDLAEELNLTTPTLTSICNEFLKKGLLKQGTNHSEKTLGRKKCPLEINRTYKYVISVSLHYMQHLISITDLMCNPVVSVPFHMEKPYNSKSFFKELANACIKLLWEQHIPSEQVLGLGVCIVGSVDHIQGISLNPFKIFDESPVPIKALLEKELPFPVCVENNVCSALNAEIMFGKAGNINALALKWGPGVGSASAINGVICKNREFHSAEIGHTYFYPGSDVICKCGRKGCLETGVSIDHIVQGIRQSLDRDSELKKLSEKVGEPDLTNINRYLDSGLPSVWNVVSPCINDLAVGISNAIQVFSPDRVILYGIMFENEICRKNVIDAVIRINRFVKEDMFVKSQLPWNKEYIGPASLVIKNFLIETGGDC